MNVKRFNALMKGIACIVITALMISGCSFFQEIIGTEKKASMGKGATYPQYEADFDEFADAVFAGLVSMDQLTLRSMVLDEEKFGIQEAQSSWGDFSEDTEKEEWEYIEDLVDILDEYDYDDLTRGQRITLDMLRGFLVGTLSLKDCPDFYDPLNPYRGNHQFFAYSLDTYQIEDKDDLDMYIELVKDIEAYVEGMCEYERKRADDGLFMRDDYADMVIEDCNEIIDNDAEDFLSGFEQRIEEFDWLDEEERDEYIKKNREYVKDHVIPAYRLIVDTLEDLKGKGKDGYGLARYDGSKEYYAEIVRSETGTSMSVDEVFEMLEEEALKSSGEMMAVISSVDYDLLTDSFSVYTSPKAIIDNNIEKMEGLFPDLPDAPDELYTVKEMPKSIARFAAGMYNLPQVDDPWDNVFYISDNSSEGLDLYEVVSHECIPGHLYQTTYFLTSDTENLPLRYLLSAFGEGLGTEEGWTTYIEGISYRMAGLPETEARYVELFYEYLYAWMSMLDIGVNYYGWTMEEAIEYFSDLGMDNFFEVTESEMENVDTMPGMYLSYTVGKIELKKMIERAKDKLGDKYSDIEFRRFYLETGPCTFDILNREMDEWMKGF